MLGTAFGNAGTCTWAPAGGPRRGARRGRAGVRQRPRRARRPRRRGRRRAVHRAALGHRRRRHVYSGTSGFRGIVPATMPALPDPHAIQFWMGPDAHLLHYAIGGDGRERELPRRRRRPAGVGSHRRLGRPTSPLTKPLRRVRRLAPGRHRDDPRGGHAVRWGAVRRAAPAALVPGPGGPARRRRPRHAAPPRARARTRPSRTRSRSPRCSREARPGRPRASALARYQRMRRARTRKIQRAPG